MEIEFDVTAKDIIENCVRGFDVVIYFDREEGKWKVSYISSGERLNPKYYIEVWREKANDILDTPNSFYEACEKAGIDVEAIVREAALGILEDEMEKIEEEVRAATYEILEREFDEVVEKIEEYEEGLMKEGRMPDTEYFCATMDEFFSDNGLRDVFEEADPIAIDSYTAERWIEEVSEKRGDVYEIWERMSDGEKKEVWQKFWEGFHEDVATYKMNLRHAIVGK